MFSPSRSKFLSTIQSRTTGYGLSQSSWAIGFLDLNPISKDCPEYNITTYEHPAMVNFMKQKGGRPVMINFGQLTAHPNDAVVNYLKREIKA